MLSVDNNRRIHLLEKRMCDHEWLPQRFFILGQSLLSPKQVEVRVCKLCGYVQLTKDALDYYRGDSGDEKINGDDSGFRP